MEWTTTEVGQFLAARNVSASTYSFYAQRDGAICLDKIEDEWLVYYCEHGLRRELAWARSEAQALDYLRLFVLEAHRLI